MRSEDQIATATHEHRPSECSNGRGHRRAPRCQSLVACVARGITASPVPIIAACESRCVRTTTASGKHDKQAKRAELPARARAAALVMDWGGKEHAIVPQSRKLEADE